MDGFAIRGADLPMLQDGMQVVGVAYPGAPAKCDVGPGRAVRITTGAPMPAGADRVVVDEAVALDGALVRLVRDPGPRHHVRLAGSDFAAGDILVRAGARLGPGAIMAAAAGEAGWCSVVRQPSVALVVTGDEVAAPKDCWASPQAIPDSISYGVAAMVGAWGGQVIERLACADSMADLSRLLRALRDACDVVVVIGGASGSERDQARSAAVAARAELLFAGVAIKPGKPVWAARSGEQMIVGLPGNPVAALVTARILLAPLIAELGGRQARAALQWRTVPSPPDIPAATDRDLFILAQCRPEGLFTLPRQESSGQSQLASLSALVRRARFGCGAPAAEITSLEI
jgi:molybdopterin molybdotransferase